MQTISANQALKLPNTIFIDVRSPCEFVLDHIPHAINLPILDNKERHEIGIIYKHDQEKAISLGLEYYSKKIPELTEFLKTINKNKTIIVYCWRGGMRSQTIANLIESLGHKTKLLKGGYKGYRAFIRKSLENYKANFKFIILWGNTGTAKTKIIEKLKSAIDLECLAQHRGSLFGAIGLTPRTQKSFETLLFFELERLASEKYIFVEGESRKIGNIIIPESIYKEIKNGINIRVNASVESRSKITIKEYLKPEYIEKIKEIVPLLKRRLSKKQVENMLRLIDERDYLGFAKILLTEYYDPLYKNTLDKIEYGFTVNSDDIDICVKELEGIRSKLL
ncbi:tRNA 2-selenouridine(34) synthase MnmH [Nanoarchaeota archaeon]